MSQEIEQQIRKMAENAKLASYALARADESVKNSALQNMAGLLKERQSDILSENSKDIAKAKADGLSVAMIDRLLLTPERIDSMIAGLKDVCALPDPVGKVISSQTLENGLLLEKVRSPLGVVGIVFESRPNVTIDAAALCLKSGNATILRGGSEALNSNIVLGQVIQDGLAAAGLPKNVVQVVGVTDRKAVFYLLKQDAFVDVIIPRGGRGLIQMVVQESTIPVIRHDIGNCHVYVDADADLKMAEEIVFNAKTQRPGVCNAMEHLLVHEKVAPQFVPVMIQRFQDFGVEVRGDELVCELVPGIKPMPEEEWSVEYLDLIAGIKVVASLDRAIEHINHYGSQHSDAIVTMNQESGRRFQREVDSAAVYVNASTRFTDGSQFGLGAEIGISTQKLHARGPMALEELTSVKFVITGSGQIRG